MNSERDAVGRRGEYWRRHHERGIGYFLLVYGLLWFGFGGTGVLLGLLWLLEPDVLTDHLSEVLAAIPLLSLTLTAGIWFWSRRRYG